MRVLVLPGLGLNGPRLDAEGLPGLISGLFGLRGELVRTLGNSRIVGLLGLNGVLGVRLGGMLIGLPVRGGVLGW